MARDIKQIVTGGLTVSFITLGLWAAIVWVLLRPL